MTVLLFIAGLVALIVGAELLVRGASRLATTMGISPLVVGLTVVAMGTSSPEVAVSVGAVLQGRMDIAVGNVVGSNIFNVLFILGMSAVITPLLVSSQIIRQEVPIAIGVSLLLAAFGLEGGSLSRLEGVFLILCMVAYVVFLVVQARRQSKGTQEESSEEPARAATWDRHWAVQILLIIGGLALLIVGSEWLVDSATAFARALGVSDLVIGLTIVAAGTSMPEVATSILAAIRKERDIAIGNVVGSNVFNILGCLGLSALVAPDSLPIPPAVLRFDLWVMIAVAFALLPIVLRREIGRLEAVGFLAYYVAYTAYVVLAAQEHDLSQPFGAVMMGFVVPLTVITLIVVVIQPKKNA